MFTGLVEGKSRLLSRADIAGGMRLKFAHDFGALELGESIALCGVCLTVSSFDQEAFDVDVSPETLSLTTLGQLGIGQSVNIERALRVGDRLGGHMVTGHVDGVAEVIQVEPEGEMKKLRLRVPSQLSAYVAKKGSLAVEGVSLTVNEVRDREVDVLVIPHTFAVTTLGSLEVGHLVNIEVDLVARYVERLLGQKNSPG